jgi:hypothetical protein
MEKLVLTLCVLTDKDHILLGMKKLRMGAGRWCAYGGRVEPGEGP